MVTQTIAESETPVAGDRTDRQQTHNRPLLDVGVLLATILVFLLFLILLIRMAFPQGSRLGDMMPGTDLPWVTKGDGGLSLADEHAGASGAFVAHLSDVRRQVQIRSADSIVWSNARVGTSVNNNDAVQTFANSRARVDFTTDNELRIGQNSLVVFRSGAADPFLQRREAAVVVLNGELNGKVAADYGSLLVEAPAGLVALNADPATGDAARFTISINPDKSSTIAVYAGVGAISVGGKRHQITANHALTVSQDGLTAGVVDLPAMPDIRAPRNATIARFRDVPPRVDFRWRTAASAQRYRLELAKDAGFEEVLVDEQTGSTSFVHANLAAGDYFWRVSARNGWTQGPASAPRRLRIERDTTPPLLEIEPVRKASGGGYALRGRTSSDARVYVLGQPVRISAAGTFEHVLDVHSGAQPIVVEAIDAVGNVAYRSQIFHAGPSVRRND